MIVKLLKSYELNTGNKMSIGSVFNRERKEAQIMIDNKIAEAYTGNIPLHKMKRAHKMKTEIFKPK